MGFLWLFGNDDSCLTREYCISKVCEEHKLSIATDQNNRNSFVMPGQFHLALGAVMVWFICFLNVALFAYVRQKNFWRAFVKFAVVRSKGVCAIQGMLVCSVLVQHHVMVHRDGLAVFLYELHLGALYELFRTLSITNSFAESAWSYVSSKPWFSFSMDHFYKVLAWFFLAVSCLNCHVLVRSFFDDPEEEVDDWPHEFSFTGKLVRLLFSFILSFKVTPLLAHLGCLMLADFLREIKADKRTIRAVERVAENHSIVNRSQTPSSDHESKDESFAPPPSSSSSSLSLSTVYNVQPLRHGVDAQFPRASAPPADQLPSARAAFSWSGSASRSRPVAQNQPEQQGLASGAVSYLSSAVSSTGQFFFGQRPRMMRDASPAAQQRQPRQQKQQHQPVPPEGEREKEEFLRAMGW